MRKCLTCDNEIANRTKVDGKWHNTQRRKYCLECSPFKQHNTKQLHKEKPDVKTCPRCEVEKPLEEFYKRKDGRPSPYCKSCHKDQTTDRQLETKRLAVEYKGGKCSLCGYDKYIGALEFHHTDPKEKDPSFSSYKLRAFDDRFKKELDKCILVCANCHREEHHRMRKGS